MCNGLGYFDNDNLSPSSSCGSRATKGMANAQCSSLRLTRYTCMTRFSSLDFRLLVWALSKPDWAKSCAEVICFSPFYVKQV